MMKNFSLLIVLLFLLSAATIAQNTNINSVLPSDVAEVFKEFNRPQTPGCAAGVNHSGELIFAKGYGSANLDYGIALEPDSRFMIASISKQFAAAALLMLEQEGLLDLDEDLRPYINEISQFDDPVTSRQLIHHTSGIRDIFNLLSIADIGLDNTTTAEQALAMLSRQNSLNFKPGTRHLYSNMAYFLISKVVEQFSGHSLREYSSEHFFEPLGMNSTHWHDDTEMIVPKRVTSYLQTDNGPGMFYRGNIRRVGDRGLFTTIEDFSKWDNNFAENRSNLENFTAKMVKHGSISSADSINYASGMRLGRYKTLYTVGHGGNYMGFRSNYVRFPDYGLGIFVFCNMSNINPAQFSYNIADLYLKDVFSGVLEEYAGIFQSITFANRVRIAETDGDLFLHKSFDEPQKLVWIDYDRFAAGSWQIRFERDENNRVFSFIVETPRTGRLSFIKQSDS